MSLARTKRTSEELEKFKYEKPEFTCPWWVYVYGRKMKISIHYSRQRETGSCPECLCWDLPKSQSLGDVFEDTTERWWQRWWWWWWQLVFSGNMPCARLCAKCFSWIISLNSHHYITHCYPCFTDADTEVNEGKFLAPGCLSREWTKTADSPHQTQQLNILFLNLNYFLAPTVIITISYKKFELN